MSPRYAYGIVAVLMFLAILTGVAYGISTRLGFTDDYNHNHTYDLGEFSVTITMYPTSDPLIPTVKRKVTVGDLRQFGVDYAAAVRAGFKKLQMVPASTNSALLMAILMSLGVRYEDARVKVTRAGIPAPPLEYERELIDWDISRIGGRAAAW